MNLLIGSCASAALLMSLVTARTTPSGNGQDSPNRTVPRVNGITCQVRDGMKKTTSRESDKVESLGKSLKPLKEHFNAGSGTHRFVALLSPT